MADGAQDWLPANAFSHDAVKAALSDCVAGWSKRWLTRGTAEISAVRSTMQDPAAPPALRVGGRLADAELSGPMKRHLLEAVLDIDLAGVTLGDGDRRILDVFATQIANDLVAVLDDKFGKAGTRGDAACIGLTLSCFGKQIAAVTVPRYVLVPELKARCGAPRTPASVPGSRVAALAPLRVTAQGLLGRADITLQDMDELAVGDVLILDKLLQEPVELRVSPGGRTIGRGMLGRNGDRVSIKL